jgi:hypothetical protein
LYSVKLYRGFDKSAGQPIWTHEVRPKGEGQDGQSLSLSLRQYVN